MNEHAIYMPAFNEEAFDSLILYLLFTYLDLVDEGE